MKIVDINDIEDIITAKIEIDKNDPNIEDKSNLNEFVQKYCTLSDVLITQNDYKAFKYVECFDHKYLFVANKDDSNEILRLLKDINYNFDHLKEIKNFIELMNTDIHMLMHNNRYYKI